MRCLILLLLSLAAGADELTPKVDALTRPLLDGGSVKSLVVGLVTADQSRVIGYGHARDAAPPTGATVYEIGSVTKVFTALLLADLVDRKIVAFDDPISRYLPVRAPEFAGKPITLLELATHHSGLPRLPSNLIPKNLADPYVDYSVDELYAFLSSYQLTRSPGAEFEYSNLGAGLLGHLLGLAAKREYPALVTERILQPLAMKHTGFDEPDVKTTAQGYDSHGHPVANWHGTALAGSGRLRSTADDLILFIKANLGLVKTKLDAPIAMSHVRRTGKMALAWGIYPNGRLWKNGGTGGFHSYVAIDPQRKIGVVVLAAGAEVDALGSNLLHLLAGEPAEK